MERYIVTLTEEERKTLGDIASKGMQRSQKILNALFLLGCDNSLRKIDRVKRRFVEGGLDAALDKRTGNRIGALVCYHVDGSILIMHKV